jgi:formylglycine-generating enzyme required for sulfatase activity
MEDTMLVGKGSRKVVLLMTGLALILPALGCSHKSPLADRCAELPSNVELPEGFFPLKGQADLAGAQDSYNGWPRYIVSPKDNMIMAYVPSQQILMGGGLQANEVPARHVVVNHFYVDLHEVSNSQFARFIKSKYGCLGAEQAAGFKAYWVCGLNNADPARNVTWREAHKYAEWSGKYLPTEAQWEAAARGSDGRLYPWGNEATSEVTRFLCNSSTTAQDYDGYAHAAPVMNFAGGVSPFGAFNMAGNVWEWCEDCYDPGRYAYPSAEDPAAALTRGAKDFGDANYPNPLQKDIREARVGPLRGNERVVRGGSYAEPIEGCRVDSRNAVGPETRKADVGFRCVLLLPPENVGG